MTATAVYNVIYIVHDYANKWRIVNNRSIMIVSDT